MTVSIRPNPNLNKPVDNLCHVSIIARFRMNRREKGQAKHKVLKVKKLNCMSKDEFRKNDRKQPIDQMFSISKTKISE